MAIMRLSSCEALFSEEDLNSIQGYCWFPFKSRNTTYVAANLPGGGRIFLHRLLMGAQKGEEVDHKNGDGLDNRRENLRLCSRTQNQQNRSIFKNNKIGLKGVYKHGSSCPQKFRAQIVVKKVKKHLGVFFSPEEAAKAYDLAAAKYFGEFAKKNFP